MKRYKSLFNENAKKDRMVLAQKLADYYYDGIQSGDYDSIN